MRSPATVRLTAHLITEASVLRTHDCFRGPKPGRTEEEKSSVLGLSGKITTWPAGQTGEVQWGVQKKGWRGFCGGATGRNLFSKVGFRFRFCDKLWITELCKCKGVKESHMILG